MNLVNVTDAARRLSLAAVALCIGATVVKADMTGKTLLEHCQSYPRITLETTICESYITGSLDAARLWSTMLNKIVQEHIACEPPDFSGEQLVAMVIKYLLDHPDQLHLSAASLVLSSYMEAFPCPNKPT